MKTPKGFILSNCNLQPTGRLNVRYTTNDSDFKGETPKAGAHDDLKNSFQVMKYALIASHGLDWPERCFPTKQQNLLHSEEEQAAMKTLRKYTKECEKQIENSVRVTGFDVSGEGKSEGVILVGMLTVKGKEQKIQSRKFLYQDSSPNAFGFEEELSDQVIDATREVEAYLFQGKTGALVKVDKNQTTLDLDETEEQPEAATHTLKPRKNARK